MKRKTASILLGLLILCLTLSGCKIEFPADVGAIDFKGISSLSSGSSTAQGIDPDDLLDSSAPEAPSQEPDGEDDESQGGETPSSSQSTVSQGTASSQAGKDQYQTDPVPADKPKPVEPEDAEVNEAKKLTCTISIRCDTILSNMGNLTAGKEGLVPADGTILAAQTVEFSEGESVFDVLLRETKRRRIHMSFRNTPFYNSNYIEAINNLYERDCGEHSGWMYKVNGWFPNYGCSRYSLRDGDVIEWVFTCDLGRDVGNEWSGEDWQQ